MAEFSINSLLSRVNKNYPSSMLIVKRAVSHTTVYVEDTVYCYLSDLSKENETPETQGSTDLKTLLCK